MYIDLFATLIPSYIHRLIFWVGGFVGAVVSFLWGNESFLLLECLGVVAAADLFMGTIAACRQGGFSSARFLQGLTRKIIYFALCAVAHMVDTVTGRVIGFGEFESFCIMALIFGEASSILENIELLGFPLPPVIGRFLQVSQDRLKTKVTDKITED